MIYRINHLSILYSYYYTYTVLVTPAWRYRIQRQSWLAAVQAVRATNSRIRARPQPENDKY